MGSHFKDAEVNSTGSGSILARTFFSSTPGELGGDVKKYETAFDTK